VIWYKRLEQEKFKWPTRMEDAVVSWSGEQLHWLLEAYDVARMKPTNIAFYARDLNQHGMRYVII